MKTKAGPIVHHLVRPILARAGLCGVLEVRDAKWARDLRAAGQGRITIRGKTEPFVAVEVEPAERDEVIAFFKKKAPRPFHKDFDQWPDPADHPAFRLDPEPAATDPNATVSPRT